MTENYSWRKPTIFSVLLTLVSVTILSSLGFWQLQRAAEKNLILLENQQQQDNAPIALTLPVDQPEKLRQQKVYLRGHFISDKQFILDNQILDHQVGYNVITPFQVSGEEGLILIDRGWIPLVGSRERLPMVEVDTQPREVIGTVYTPYGKAYSLGEMDGGETAWPRRIQYLDFKTMSNRLGQSVQALTIRMHADQADSYKAEWKLFSITPNKHLGYVVQWFGLAITVLVIFIYLHFPKAQLEK